MSLKHLLPASRSGRVAVTAASIVFGLFVLGCAIPSDDSGSGGDGTDTTVTTPSTTDTDSTDQGESFQVLYDSPDKMGDYAEAVIEDFIDPWLEEEYPGMPLPQLKYVPEGQEGREGCDDGSGNDDYTSESYEYCPADEIIYLGQDSLWEFFQQAGDAGPAFGIAHETGHHIQNELGIFNTAGGTAAESIEIEDQADCAGGAWTQWMSQKGYLEPDDLNDIDNLFPLIASSEDDPNRDHGTLDERKAEWQEGYTDGLAGCGFPTYN